MLDQLIIFGATYLAWVPPVALAIYFLSLPRAEKWRMGALSVIAFPAAFLLSRAASLFYYSERPFVRGAAALIEHAPDNGFPSDHALLAFVVAFAAFAQNRPLGYFLFLIAVLISAARVFSGVHSPVDVIGSAAIAFAAVIAGAWMRRYLNFNK